MRWCAAAFVIGGRHLAASSASESSGMLEPEGRDLLEASRGSALEVEPLDRLELALGGVAPCA